MRHIFSLLLILIMSKLTLAQTVNVGPDLTIPACQACTTLYATTTAPTTSTNNYNVTQITYNPYSYLPGTVIPLNIDDRWSDVYNLPFQFCFFGNNYTQFIVSSNGQLSFN